MLRLQKLTGVSENHLFFDMMKLPSIGVISGVVALRVLFVAVSRRGAIAPTGVVALSI